MAATVSSLFDANKTRIEERISRSVELFLAQADPVWRDTALSAQGVGPVDAWGRGYELIKIFQNAIGGVIESSGPRGDWTTFGDDSITAYGKKITIQGNTRTMPDAADDPSGAPIKLRVPLRGLMTNLKMTLGERQAEALPAFIGSITAPRMVAFARNLARRLCSSWYVSQADYYKLCGLGPSSGTGAYSIDGTAKTITFYPDNKATSRFAVGDRVDIFNIYSSVPVRHNDTNVTSGGVVSGDGAGQTFSTRVKCFVSAVDKLQGKVVLQFDPATSSGKFSGTGSLASGQLGNSAFIVPANSTVAGAAFTDIPGINSWLKYSGSSAAANRQLLGDEALGTTSDGIIDVGQHPEFASFYKSVGGVLTEHRLNLYLDRIMEAFEDDGHFIDTLVTTPGVIRAMAAQQESRMYLDRTGRTQSLTMSGEDGKGLVHHHDGREYSVNTSRWMEFGTMIGYRRQGNWTRYTPPATPGSQAMPGVEPGIPFEFLVPAITGLPTTKWPIYSNGNLTDATQMPGHLRMTLVPEKQVRGMKLVNLTEERILADAGA